MNPRLLLIQTSLASRFALLMLSLPVHVFAQHPLDSWVRRTVPGPNAPLNSVVYGNGTFVAVGNNSFVARSTDGGTWTTSTAGDYGNLKRVRFLNGQFVAVGLSDKMLFSIDGASWTAAALPEANFWDVAWGNGVYVAAGLNTYISADALNWTLSPALTTQVLGQPPFAITNTYQTLFDSVVFANGGFLGLPMGGGGAGRKNSWFSTNGVNWAGGGSALTGYRDPGFEAVSELVFADGLWLATTHEGTDSQGVEVSDNNGANWCCRFSVRWGGALAFGQGHYLWIKNNYESDPQRFTVYDTTDGSSWAARFGSTNANLIGIRSAVFGNGTFVAVGVDGSGAIHSHDGTGTSYVLQSGNISGLPIIFQEPVDRSAVVDNPGSFSVQAVGAPTLIYQWYRNSIAINGATNASYTIAHVTTDDVAGYHAVIANSFGSVTSRVAQLTVAFLGIDCYAGVKILGVPGRTYRVEATPATGNPNWQTLTNLVLPSTPYIWIDYDSPTLPDRLYRASELP